MASTKEHLEFILEQLSKIVKSGISPIVLICISAVIGIVIY